MGSPASPRNVGAVQPSPRAARLLHTRRTLSKPAFSSYRRFLVLCSFTTLVAASSPRYHFVCLSRGGPSRRRALPYSRTLFSHPCVHISIACSALSLSLSLSHILLAPAMHAALHPPSPRASRVSLARDDRIRRITTCVFYEPRRTALAKTNARRFPGCFDCSRDREWGMRGSPSTVVTLSPCLLCARSRGYGDRHPCLRSAHAYFARSSRYGRRFRKALRRVPARCNGAVTVCSRSALR